MTELHGSLRVLIFHIRISMGHERAAQALAEALRRRVPAGVGAAGTWGAADSGGRGAVPWGVDVRLVEAIGYSSGWLAPVVCRSYLSVVKYAPPLWDFLYDDPRSIAAAEPLLAYWSRRSRKNFLTLMSEFRPHLVICTQALPARILARLKEWGYGDAPGMDAPVYAVATDFSIHRYWSDDRIDGYFLPGRNECRKLVAMNVPQEKIFLSGIPIHPDMAEPVADADLDRARRSLGLDPDRHTLLLMGGSRGLGIRKGLLRELEHLPFPINILAPAGTNLPVLEVLRRWSAESKHNVVPLEFSSDIRTLYALSDLAVTKPGGLTLAECMAVGLPMVIQHALPGQERHNLEFVRERGLGEIGAGPADVASRVHALLMDPGRRAQLKLRLKCHARPNAAFTVVDQVLSRVCEPAPSSPSNTVCPTPGH